MVVLISYSKGIALLLAYLAKLLILQLAPLANLKLLSSRLMLKFKSAT